MRTLVCYLVLAAVLSFAGPATAQGPTADEFRRLPDELRLIFIAGYISGFALAAQLPGERAAIMQRCFNEWSNAHVMAIADSWFIRNSREVQNAEVTARIALFQALAEACGWKRRP
jgi:hypothetical protein